MDGSKTAAILLIKESPDNYSLPTYKAKTEFLIDNLVQEWESVEINTVLYISLKNEPWLETV